MALNEKGSLLNLIMLANCHSFQNMSNQILLNRGLSDIPVNYVIKTVENWKYT